MLQVARVAMLATWQGSGRAAHSSEINAMPQANGVSLYTPAWGPATAPAAAGAVQVAVSPLPPTLRTSSWRPRSPSISARGTAMPIPAGGAVLVARGTAGARLQAEAPVGQPSRSA